MTMSEHDYTLSDLASAGGLDPSDLFLIRQGDGDRKINLAALETGILSGGEGAAKVGI
jgi:hypothetical protein